MLLGFPDTTRDADLFIDRSPENGRALVAALRELGFALTEGQASEIERGKDFVQLKNGQYDADLGFAPDGIERFGDAWKRHVEVEGFPVCHLDASSPSPARGLSTAKGTANRCLACGRSANIGSATAEGEGAAGTLRPKLACPSRLAVPDGIGRLFVIDCGPRSGRLGVEVGWSRTEERCDE